MFVVVRILETPALDVSPSTHAAPIGLLPSADGWPIHPQRLRIPLCFLLRACPLAPEGLICISPRAHLPESPRQLSFGLTVPSTMTTSLHRPPSKCPPPFFSVRSHSVHMLLKWLFYSIPPISLFPLTAGSPEMAFDKVTRHSHVVKSSK